MNHRFLQFLLIAALFVGMPALVADRFLAQREYERNVASRQDFFRHMEEVLHRVKRNGRPEYLGKMLIDRACRRIARGADPMRMLERLQRSFGGDWEFQVFSAAGTPLEFGGKRPTKIAVRQKLVQNIFPVGGREAALSPSDEKMAAQLFGDGSAVTILAASQGFFRRFGNPVLYSHGGWWKVSNGRKTLYLLALLKAGGFGNNRLLRSASRSAARRVKGLFAVALTGGDRGPSFQRLPPAVRRLVKKIPGQTGRFGEGDIQGVAVACPNGLSLKAWRRLRTTVHGEDDFSRIAVRVGAGLLLVLLIRLILFGNPFELSLRLVVPALILGGTLPVLGYLGISMGEQRSRHFEKQVYEAHREIEDHLRRIDADLSVRKLAVAARYREMLRELSEVATRAEDVVIPPERFHPSIIAGFLFGKDGKIRSTLFASEKGQPSRKGLIEMFTTKFADAFYGRANQGNLEDPMVPFYLKRLGSFLEVKYLEIHKFDFVDIRQLAHAPREIIGIFLEHRVETFAASYLREVLKNPPLRRGLRFAVVSHEEGVLLKTAPNGFLRNPDALRLGEQVLETGTAVDAILPQSRGEPLIVTGFLCRNLSGWVLVGGIPMTAILAENERLGLWTLAAAGALILLGLISAGLLVTMIVTGLRGLGEGVDAIRRNEFVLALPVSGADEFAQLARGIEKAAVTLEEIYSSLPVQETLVRCDPLLIGDVSLAGSFRPGPEPGGDYLDAFPIADGKVLLAIGDVLGTGWQTTLAVSSVKMAVRLIFSRPFPSLEEGVDRLNRHFIAVRGSLKRMSLLVGILDPSSGLLTCVSAGHCPPILCRAGTGSMLPGGGAALGALNARRLGKYQETLRDGDRVLLYTDGWIKMKTSGGAELGSAGLCEALAGTTGREPAEILGELLTMVERSGHTHLADDDCTALAVVFRKRKPEGGA